MNFMRTALLLAAMTGLFLAVGYLLAGEGGLLIAFFIALAMNAWAYWNSDKAVLRMHHARLVTKAEAPGLVGLVEQLARRAELPMPKVFILETDQPNAFATGRNPENSAVAVTRGLLDNCDSEELAGVIAHELAHIKHRDTLTMTITATLAGAIGFLSQFAFFFGMGRDNRNPLGLIGTLAIMILAPLAAMLVQMAISRTREYVGGPHGRRDLRPADVAGPGAAEDRAAGARRGQPPGRAQPGLGASVHHQPAAHGRGRQSVPHPPADRRAGAPPAAAGGRRWPGRRPRPLGLRLGCAGRDPEDVTRMSKATYPLKLPVSIKEAAARLAKEDGVSLNQWIASAVAEKVGTVQTAALFLKQRAGTAKPEDLLPLLRDAPDVPAEPDDVLK